MPVEFHDGLPSWDHLNNETSEEDYNQPPIEDENGNDIGEKPKREYRDPLHPMITFACGHRAEKKWASPEIDASDPDYYTENGLCPKCFLDFKRIDPVYASVVNKKVWSLPELTGSDKQISWAETVRYKAAAVNFYISENKISLNGALPEELYNEKNAKFWIEHRTEVYRAETALVTKLGIHSASKIDISFQVKENSSDVDITVEFTDPEKYLKKKEVE
jgi:hypothetical protein